MKDFLGNELQIGDDVIYVNYNVRNILECGKIITFTPQNVRVTCSHGSLDGTALIHPSCIYLIKKLNY